ncbi:MAG: hypothetical protein NZ902_06615 [Acidilobaceae archaeon]|nr:hypothetical protein [Acidilobaceae archaeon]
MSVERLREIRTRVMEIEDQRRRLMAELRNLRAEEKDLRSRGFRLRGGPRAGNPRSIVIKAVKNSNVDESTAIQILQLLGKA